LQKWITTAKPKSCSHPLGSISGKKYEGLKGEKYGKKEFRTSQKGV